MPSAGSLRMPGELTLDPAAADRVEYRPPDLWVEVDATGSYTDVGTEAERRIIAELGEQPWEEVVARHFAETNPWLYQVITDRGRSLLLDFLPIDKGGAFLDVGAGWGQVAIPLARHGHVFCLDLTLARLDILRAVARQQGVRLSYVAGNFNTFPFGAEQFDLVIFNGSLEWIALGSEGAGIWEMQCAALTKAHHILKPGGLVYVGIENALGLKYLLGAPDDHTGIAHLTFLDEMEASARYAKVSEGRHLRAKTWSLNEYLTLLTGAGLEVVEVYACFPDYKLIRSMVPLATVNQFLADTGLPHPEHSGADGTALPFNNILGSLYRRLAKNGIAQYFCPSYGLIAKKST